MLMNRITGQAGQLGQDSLRKIVILGHMACGTWDMSHFCFVFQLEPDKFVNFRADISDHMLFYTALKSPFDSYYCRRFTDEDEDGP